MATLRTVDTSIKKSSIAGRRKSKALTLCRASTIITVSAKMIHVTILMLVIWSDLCTEVVLIVTNAGGIFILEDEEKEAENTKSAKHKTKGRNGDRTTMLLGRAEE